MKTLLITGFDPFGSGTVNPSWEAVKLLPPVVGAYRIVPARIPTVYGLAGKTAAGAAEACGADAILCVGQAGGRRAVTSEAVAINLRYSTAPDNAGVIITDEPVVPGGPAAYFSTLPARKMAAAICAGGLPGAVSTTAGTFVCNDVFYSLLHAFHDRKVGFIHVPFLPEQAADGQPSLPLADTVRALTAAVAALE